MATPTPMKHAPSQQGRTPSQSQHGAVATPAASTPFSVSHNAAFSPHGPKSSPQYVKRSPATSTTLMGHPINAPANFDSPTAAALGALGIGNGLEIGLDHVGVGGLGDLGHVGRDDDDEKVKRLHRILDILKESKGRVSEAGLERLVRNIGLEFLWEDGGGSDRSRTLIIAGSALSIDIVMSNNIVENVTLSFPDSAEVVSRHVDQAGQILLDDLKLGPHESPLTKKLDKFAVNLERLALLDKLSVIPGFNCHEAVAGIHENMERLYQWDMAKLRADPAMAGRSEEFLATMVLCSRHGHPGMHKRDRVGMTLDYWRERHLVPSGTESCAKRTWGMWIGCASATAVMGYQPARVSDAWLSPLIEKSSIDAEHLLLETNPGEPSLDWQEPPNTFLPADDDEEKARREAHEMAVDGMDPSFHGGPTSRLPDVVFMAEFDPPVVMTLPDWTHMHEIVQVPPPDEYSFSTFDNLVFPIPLNSQHDPTELRTITRLREVAVFPSPNTGDPDQSSAQHAAPTSALHRNSLFIYKPVYGRTLSSVPFSHPSQLVHMLPRLRQYAFLSTLLQRSFGPAVGTDSGGGDLGSPGIGAESGGLGAPSASSGGIRGPKGSREGAAAGRSAYKQRKIATTTMRDDFAHFMAGPEDLNAHFAQAHGDMDMPDDNEGAVKKGPSSDDPAESASSSAIPLDVTLTVHPVPRLQVVFPFRGGTATVVLDVQLNGMVHVVSENVLGGDSDEGRKGKRRQLQPQDLGQVLQTCEDLDQWCEWIRSRLE